MMNWRKAEINIHNNLKVLFIRPSYAVEGNLGTKYLRNHEEIRGGTMPAGSSHRFLVQLYISVFGGRARAEL